MKAFWPVFFFWFAGTSVSAQAGLIRDHLPVQHVRIEGQGVREDADVYLPRYYSRDRQWPLVVLLHGFTSSKKLQELYMMLGNYVSDKGFVLLVPQGTQDSKGQGFWNATDDCCDFERSGVDDSGYLQRLITKVEARYNVDAGRIYLFGHSNGSFMAHRLACDADGRFAGLVSLAGSTFRDPRFCETRSPMAVLHAHGTADETILYTGRAEYPGAMALMEHWARRNQCTGQRRELQALNLSPFVRGNETDIYRWTGCAEGTEVEHWRMHGMGHVPFFEFSTSGKALDFLLRHRRR